jgi:hypothetical protein
MSDQQPPKPKQDKFYEFKPFRVPKYRIEFQRATRLADIPGYVWYSPALIYIWGRYSETNLADLVQQHDVKVFWYKFEKPVFRGLTVGSDSAWDYTLWASSESDWPKIVDTILETVQFDIPRSRLYQYALQELEIYDPLSCDAKSIVGLNTPTVLVKTFAVLSNELQYAYDTRKKGVVNQPAVASFKPDPLHVEAGKKLFSRKGLTQDKAFDTYKSIMLSMQDAHYRAERLKKEAERRKVLRGK